MDETKLNNIITSIKQLMKELTACEMLGILTMLQFEICARSIEVNSKEVHNAKYGEMEI